MIEQDKKDHSKEIAFCLTAMIMFGLGYKFGSRATWKRFEGGWAVKTATPITLKNGNDRLRIQFNNGTWQDLKPTPHR